jgi:hypothetical protein
VSALPTSSAESCRCRARPLPFPFDNTTQKNKAAAFFLSLALPPQDQCAPPPRAMNAHGDGLVYETYPRRSTPPPRAKASFGVTAHEWLTRLAQFMSGKNTSRKRPKPCSPRVERKRALPVRPGYVIGGFVYDAYSLDDGDLFGGVFDAPSASGARAATTIVPTEREAAIQRNNVAAAAYFAQHGRPPPLLLHTLTHDTM